MERRILNRPTNRQTDRQRNRGTDMPNISDDKLKTVTQRTLEISPRGKAKIPESDRIQVITVYFHKLDSEDGKAWAIEGWFGYSKRYTTLDNALADTAHRCGFNYKILPDDDDNNPNQQSEEIKTMPNTSNNSVTQKEFTKNIKALLNAGKRQISLTDVAGQDIREAYKAGNLEAWLTPILKTHDKAANPIGHKNLLQLVRDNTDSKLSLMPIEKGSLKGYKINDKPATRNTKVTIAQLIKRNDAALELSAKVKMTDKLRKELADAYAKINNALAKESNAQNGTSPKTEAPKTEAPKAESNVIKYGANGVSAH